MKYSFCLKFFAVLFCLFSLNSKATTNGDDQLFGFLKQIKSLSVDDYEALPDFMKSVLTTAEAEKDPGHKVLLKISDRLAFSNLATEFNNDSIIVRGEVRNGDRMGVREVQIQGRISKKDTEDNALQTTQSDYLPYLHYPFGDSINGAVNHKRKNGERTETVY